MLEDAVTQNPRSEFLWYFIICNYLKQLLKNTRELVKHETKLPALQLIRDCQMQTMIKPFRD